MANTNVEYIASTIPAAQIYVSFDTLFRIAQQQFGNALNWVDIAEMNGITDPWIFSITQILIPAVISTSPPDGVLGDTTATAEALADDQAQQASQPIINYPFPPTPPFVPYVNSEGAMQVDPSGNVAAVGLPTNPVPPGAFGSLWWNQSPIFWGGEPINWE
jgi:LysM domain